MRSFGTVLSGSGCTQPGQLALRRRRNRCAVRSLGTHWIGTCTEAFLARATPRKVTISFVQPSVHHLYGGHNGSAKPDDSDVTRRELPPLLVTREEAANALSLGVSTFMREVRVGRIPAPRAVSPGRVGWLWWELEAFAAALPPSSIPPPLNAGNRRRKS